MKGVFVTGTDTDCGKTAVALGLMELLRQRGKLVLGMKPVASGCDETPAGLRNPDALRLLAHGSRPVAYELVNPYAFAPPIAPHIAATRAGTAIELEVIRRAAARLGGACDLLVVEGVGGWRVPLGPSLFVSDLPPALELPVILVCGVRLGCINHSLLSLEGIRARGARVLGWIANQVEPDMQALDENLAALAALMDAPCLGTVPWLPTRDPRLVARHLDLAPWLGGAQAAP